MTTAARRLCNSLPTLTLLLLAGCATTQPPEDSVSRVSVTFIEPEKFTDARRSDLDSTSPRILRDLEAFLIDTGARYVPPDMKLNIRITDVDLAGDFESFRGPQADHVRINKGLYPPRLTLEFELFDGAAKIVKMGRRELTDIDYQSRAVYSREDYLRYEKEILRDWMRTEFGDLKGRMAG